MTPPLAHQQADEYVEMASHLVLYPVDAEGATTTTSSTGGEAAAAAANGQLHRLPAMLDGSGGGCCFPFEAVSVLQYLKSPMRRPTIIESWSPLEIALFEASIAEYGKDFHKIQKEVRTKSTKEIIDFYYIWKKTEHYRRWKDRYVPPYLDHSDADSDGGDDNNKKKE